jgi:hypothetical protein
VAAHQLLEGRLVFERNPAGQRGIVVEREGSAHDP